MDTKDLYGAILLSLLGQTVPLDTKVRGLKMSITIEDMVANGLLVASLTDVNTTISVLPNMQLLSLIRWAFFTKNTFIKDNMCTLGLDIALLIAKLVDIAIVSDPITGKICESTCIIRHLIMPHVYK